jgi:O-antigen ligase
MNPAHVRQAPNRIVVPVADWFVVVAGLAFTTSILPILLAPGGGAEAGSPLVRGGYLALYAVSIALLIYAGAVPAVITRLPLLAAVLGWSVTSVFWSVAPTETVERLIGLIGSSALGIFLGWHYRGGDVVRLLAWSMLWAVALSAAAIVLVPSIGIDDSGGPWAGAWLGLHFHKNALGTTAALGVLLLVFALPEAGGWQRRLVFILGAVLSLLLLAGSRSTTSVLACGVGLVVAGGLLLVRSAPAFGFLALLVVAVNFFVFAVLAVQLDLVHQMLAWLGKSETLSSRVPLWQLTWLFAQDRFWLGYGYGVFWLPDLAWVDLIEARLRFVPFYSHNGILELWIGGGLVSVLLVAALYLLTLLRGLISFLRSGLEPESAFPLAFMAYLAAQNFSEATLLMRDDLSWIIFLSLASRYGRLVSVRVRVRAPWRAFHAGGGIDAGASR